MNPIGILCTAIASGCAAGLLVVYRGRRAGKDAEVVQIDAELDDFVAALQPVKGIVEGRQRTRDERAQTLRNIYLADLAAAAEEPEEVLAR
jgi:hypothetical protein